MNVETDPLPPVPRHTPPIADETGKEQKALTFQIPWMQWFVQVREKVNVINTIVTNLSKVITSGIMILAASGEWVSREIKGTTARISVANGTGISGDPTVDIDAAYAGQASIDTVGTITTGTWQGTVIDNAYLDAAPKMVTTSTSATGGSATALPAQPVGYVQISIGGSPFKIPYYDL